jgi:hypothetical protein
MKVAGNLYFLQLSCILPLIQYAQVVQSTQFLPYPSWFRVLIPGMNMAAVEQILVERKKMEMFVDPWHFWSAFLH